MGESCFLNKFFDAIYCINLDKRQDRWADVQNEFNKFNIKVKRFTAVDGSTLSMLPGQKIMPGEYGCNLSHAAILNEMIVNNYQRVLIFEDDIYFTMDPSIAVQAMIEYLPPKWDMLYLGGNHVIAPVRFGPIYKCVRTFTTSSYGISREFAEKAYALLHLGEKQIDVTYGGSHLRGNSFCVYPSCCRQKTGYSDIQGGHVDYGGVRW